jgi:hypothetical protein
MRFKDFLTKLDEEEQKKLQSDANKPVDPKLSQMNKIRLAAKSAQIGKEAANKGKNIDIKA